MKTKIRMSLLIALLYLTANQSLNAQWSNGTGFVYPTTITNRVMIGGSVLPSYPLQVNSNVIAGNLSSGDSVAVGMSDNGITAVGTTYGLTRHALFGTTQLLSDILFANKVSSTYDYYERMRINRFGRVGIGTPAPDTSALLDISTTNKGLLIPRIALTSTSDGTTITLPAKSLLVYNTATGGLSPAGYWYNAGTSASPNWIQLEDSNSWSRTGNSGTTASTAAIGSTVTDNFIGTTDYKDWVMATNNLERARIKADGKVGIGTNAPAKLIEIAADNTGVTENNVLRFTDKDAATATGQIAGKIEFYSSDATPNSPGVVSYIDTKATGSGALYNMHFGTGNSATITDRMTIDNVGNVGIGTTAPSEQLELQGGGIQLNDTMGIAFIGEKPYNANVVADGAKIYYDSGSLIPGSGSNDALVIEKTDVSSTVPDGGIVFVNKGNNNVRNVSMTIRGDGSVGIGTTAPTVLLQVGNSGDGTVAKANAWNTFSDANFKTNVVTIQDALKKVLSLRGVTYDWIASGEPSIGFIAQEVDTVLHCIVLTDTATGFKSLDYSKIVPVIVEGIKQLDSINMGLVSKDSINDAKIQALETKDSILKAKLHDQDSIITLLQNQLAANNTLLQTQLNELMTTINSCCNQLMESSTNNQETKSLAIPEGETTQTDVELNNAQTIILEQNSPNPYAERTSINYYLPDDTGKAQIVFYNAQGKLIQSVELIQKGKGMINVFASDLSNGIYTYTLVVDGRVIDSKKMVKNK
jgi:hypothetical protein